MYFSLISLLDILYFYIFLRTVYSYSSNFSNVSASFFLIFLHPYRRSLIEQFTIFILILFDTITIVIFFAQFLRFRYFLWYSLMHLLRITNWKIYNVEDVKRKLRVRRSWNFETTSKANYYRCLAPCILHVVKVFIHMYCMYNACIMYKLGKHTDNVDLLNA